MWAWDGFAVFGGAVLDLEDFLVSNLFLPLGSLVYLPVSYTHLPFWHFVPPPPAGTDSPRAGEKCHHR